MGWVTPPFLGFAYPPLSNQPYFFFIIFFCSPGNVIVRCQCLIKAKNIIYILKKNEQSF